MVTRGQEVNGQDPQQTGDVTVCHCGIDLVVLSRVTTADVSVHTHYLYNLVRVRKVVMYVVWIKWLLAAELSRYVLYPMWINRVSRCLLHAMWIYRVFRHHWDPMSCM